MGLLLIIVYTLLLLFILTSGMDRGSRRIVLIFVSYWFVSLYISTLQPFGFYRPSDSTLLVLALNVIAFVIGFSTIKINKNETTDLCTTPLPQMIEKVLRNPVFIIAFFVALLYVLFLMKQYYAKLMFLGSLGELRGEFFSGNLYGPYHDFFEMLLLYPIYSIVTPIFGYKSVYKRDVWFYLFFVYLFVYASLGGGRLGYIRMAVPIIFSALCMKRESFFKHNASKKILLGVLGIVIVFVFMSVTSTMRSGNVRIDKEAMEEGFEITAEQIVTYTSGPVVAFDYAVKHNYVERLGGYQYGMLTLAGIENIFYTTIGKLAPYKRPINEFMKIKQEESINVSKDVDFWNALYTWAVFFYLDFGIVGVIVIPYLIGLLFRKLIKSFYKAPSFSYFAILNLLFIFIFLSVLDYFMILIYQVVVLGVFLYKGKKYERSISQNKRMF